MTILTQKNYQERILKVLIYIQNHLDEALSLEQLAQIAHFSDYHFHRIFTTLVGESVKSYLRRLRLERATRDLVFTDLSLVQISERAGYDTQQAFHRAFKEIYGQTPLQFKEEKQKTVIKMSKMSEKRKDPIVHIQKIEPKTVAFMRHIGPYEHVMETWVKLMGEIGSLHFFSDQVEKISIPYDDIAITPAEKLRFDACVTLNGLSDFKPKDKMGVQTLRGGKYAVLTHVGPLENIEKSYENLFGVWLPKSGYEPADFPNFLIHKTMPFQTPAESLLTDIYLPIK